MKKILVVYFSAERGRTKKLANDIAKLTDADLFEIKPVQPYSKTDVNYMIPLARCNKEKVGKRKVPVKDYPDNFDQYEMVLIGFPIWYGCQPNVVSTFCDSLDFTYKKVAAFATSGGSPIGKTIKKLTPYIHGTNVIDARLFNEYSEMQLLEWINNL